mgnify:FL=1
MSFGDKTSIDAGVKKVVKKRSGGICEMCQMRESEEVHHILPNYMGGLGVESNLIDLCHVCHWSAPNSPEGFKKYKADGGLVWRMIRVGFACGLGFASELGTFHFPQPT